jgi:hypothetical protein
MNTWRRCALHFNGLRKWISREHTAHTEGNGMRDLRGALDLVHDFAHAKITLSLIEMAPRRQGDKIDRVRLLDLGARWRSPARPTRTAATAANLALAPSVAPPPDENLLAQQCPRAMHTRPLRTPRDEPFLDALCKHVSKPVLLRVLTNHDERRPPKDRPVSPEHRIHRARNVRMYVLNESTQRKSIGNADERVPVVGHEREGVKIDGKQSQGAPEHSENHAIQRLAWSQQKSLANRLRGDLDDKSSGNKPG